ncbi:hypothetical protein [Kosakonia sacchari]|uniref:hypothetical protein n=1 Tax=Kosakonia sacchari TaxID=1158459 RepID=UPI0028AB8F77|nr:hypothetical protein [Kosakonia sacchari]
MGLKGRLIIILIGAILGIPTSVIGYQLMGFKVLKQEVDCITDLNDAVRNWSSNVEQGSAGRELGNINTNLRTCVKGIDAKKSNIDFAMEQYKRYH